MQNWAKRAVGYGSAAAVASALVYAGFVYRADADVFTMLNSVEIQLRMASAMPATDRAGAALKTREELLASAAGHLDHIERLEPGLPQAREYLAFLTYLRGDAARAAQLYHSVREREDCSAEIRDISVLNEARMLRLAGHGDQARALLRQEGDRLQPESRARLEQELAQLQTAVSK